MIDVLSRIFFGVCILAAFMGVVIGIAYLLTVDGIILIIVGIFLLLGCYAIGDIIRNQ